MHYDSVTESALQPESNVSSFPRRSPERAVEHEGHAENNLDDLKFSGKFHEPVNIRPVRIFSPRCSSDCFNRGRQDTVGVRDRDANADIADVDSEPSTPTGIILTGGINTELSHCLLLFR